MLEFLPEIKAIVLTAIGSALLWAFNKLIKNPLEKIDKHDNDIKDLKHKDEILEERIDNLKEDIKQKDT